MLGKYDNLATPEMQEEASAYHFWLMYSLGMGVLALIVNIGTAFLGNPKIQVGLQQVIGLVQLGFGIWALKDIWWNGYELEPSDFSERHQPFLRAGNYYLVMVFIGLVIGCCACCVLFGAAGASMAAGGHH